ncbi:helix-turn-helix domain-containing protein [Dorea formicigenerans]|uniref:helix-turn-helix domain-containing protein n=2 Tax=Dorea formicigenerans TaxID=39486 RepID=UPI001D09E5F8|nr:helix-turn-helix transcriptional regulator [Dorea formicigenerans]MCB8575686.1 helix-turn-helix domain-containing protein [Dorea formicigenerans]
MKDIGAVLKNARENKEFTQKQVMELTGINKKSLSGYENNVAEPDLQTFATLINLYGLSADEVLEISTSAPCIFRKNCASVPEERSAIPLQTEQSSAG